MNGLYMSHEKTAPSWAVYILKCADNTLYTGISNNVTKRIATHNTGKGAKYTKPRLPVYLVYSEIAKDRSHASKREAQIKKLTKTQKQILISQPTLI